MITKNGFVIHFMQNYQNYTVEQIEMALVVIQNIFIKKITLFNNIQFALIPITTSLVQRIYNESDQNESIQEHCVKCLANIVSLAPNKEQKQKITNFFISCYYKNENLEIKINSLRGISFLLKYNDNIEYEYLKKIENIVIFCHKCDEVRLQYYGFILGELLVNIFGEKRERTESILRGKSTQEEIMKIEERDLLTNFIRSLSYEKIRDGIVDPTEMLCLAAIKFASSVALYNQENELIENGFVDALFQTMNSTYEIRTASLYLLCILYCKQPSLLDVLLEHEFDPTTLSDALQSNYTDAYLFALNEMASNEVIRDQMIENNIIEPIMEIVPTNQNTETLKEQLIEILSANQS